jgi:hypothetical protein
MLAAALGGLDAFEFSRHWGDLATIRARIAEKLAWLGVVFDPAANVRHDQDRLELQRASLTPFFTTFSRSAQRCVAVEAGFGQRRRRQPSREARSRRTGRSVDNLSQRVGRVGVALESRRRQLRSASWRCRTGATG